MIRRTVKNTVIVIAVILFIFLLRAQFVNVEHAIVTVNVPGNSTVEEVSEVLDVFTKRDAQGTFFVPGVWAEIHPEVVRRIAAEHELACYTYSERRLAPLNGTALEEELDCSGFENLTGVPVIGFRAPANDVGVRSYAAIAERFEYDSSVYRRYEWFWEERPAELVEVPITSVLLLPLDDWFGNNVFRMGDFFYWLAKKAKQDPVVVAVTVGTANDHLLDLEYLIAYYQTEANVTTIRDWLGD